MTVTFPTAPPRSSRNCRNCGKVERALLSAAKKIHSGLVALVQGKAAAPCVTGSLCSIRVHLPAFPLMPASRLLLFCFAALSFAAGLGAEPTKAKRAASRETRAEPEEPGITFNSVHVDGSYIAMTFDDGPSATLTPKLLDL